MLPPELAYRFPTNGDFVIQTHFHPSGKVEHETSTIGIYLAKQPPTKEDVDRVRTRALTGIDLQLRNSESIGLTMSEWISKGDWRLLFLNRDRLRKVTPEDVLNATILADSSNTLAGAAELMVNPLLPNADRFYLFVGGNAVKPVIFQERRGVTAAALRDAEEGFFRKNWFFGVDARYNVGYGLLQYAVLTTLT